MPESKGHLNPGAPGVELDRFAVSSDLEEVVRHIWVARWSLAPGEVSRQRVLTYPTFNLVVVDQSARLYGPDPRVQVRELSGRGCALGILLRPAAGRLLGVTEAVELVGASRPMEGAPVHAIRAHLEAPRTGEALVELVSRWLRPLAAELDDQGRLMNRVSRTAEENANLLRVTELAERVGMSPRNLERLTMNRLGVTPKWLIECRRLHEAAKALRSSLEEDLTDLSLRLGYVDYAHFSKRYKEILGETPEQTRAPLRLAL